MNVAYTRELPNEAPLPLWWCRHPCTGPEMIILEAHLARFQILWS